MTPEPTGRRCRLNSSISAIFPVLTPLAVDPSHPFPLHPQPVALAWRWNCRSANEGWRSRSIRFARVKVPPSLPRAGAERMRRRQRTMRFVLLEEIIAEQHRLSCSPDMHGARLPLLPRHAGRRHRDRGRRGRRPDPGNRGAVAPSPVRFRRGAAGGRRRHVRLDSRYLLMDTLELDDLEDVWRIDGPLALSELWALLRLDRRT